MKAVVQRVSHARVTVDSEIIGQIDQGVLILVCAMDGDSEAQADQLASKISKLRIFKDADGKMNHSLKDTSGSALVVSQFTLAGDTSRGNRPGFSRAAAPDQGEALYKHFVNALKALDVPVQTGRFGADMAVELLNDGPVTILYDI
ncbi:D-aminoacyl-tRNA deacylase [Planktotalea sp.]|uniref:D-aminoacyl-tRNA deacylase n=1 Tax=Planktotalea sp. TaxID=2029877 RepID=UPI003D6A20BA